MAGNDMFTITNARAFSSFFQQRAGEQADLGRRPVECGPCRDVRDLAAQHLGQADVGDFGRACMHTGIGYDIPSCM